MRGQLVQHDLRMDAYNRIQSREVSFFEEHRLGEINVPTLLGPGTMKPLQNWCRSCTTAGSRCAWCTAAESSS